MINEEKNINISKMQEYFRNFVKERNWDKFQTPKNLSMALSVEAAELVEIFQWLSQKESFEIIKDKNKQEAIEDEVADIFIYLIRISDVLNIDLEKAFYNKFQKNLKKYPLNESKPLNKLR
jgi:dCTP diphosphatase